MALNILFILMNTKRIESNWSNVRKWGWGHRVKLEGFVLSYMSQHCSGSRWIFDLIIGQVVQWVFHTLSIKNKRPSGYTNSNIDNKCGRHPDKTNKEDAKCSKSIAATIWCSTELAKTTKHDEQVQNCQNNWNQGGNDACLGYKSVFYHRLWFIDE